MTNGGSLSIVNKRQTEDGAIRRLRATIRLASWEICLADDTKRLHEVIAQEQFLNDQHQLKKLSYTSFQEAANLLLQLGNYQAAGTTDLSINELLTNFAELSNRKIETTWLLKTFYHLYAFNPMGLIAIFALLDVIVDEMLSSNMSADSRYTWIVDLMDLVLVQNMLKGLNIWTLLRRFRDAVYKIRFPQKLEEFEEHYRLFQLERQAIAHELIRRLKAEFADRIVLAEPYERSLSGLYRSRIPLEARKRTIFLKVVCREKADCYAVECWIHEQGEVLPRLIRNTLHHGHYLNGARRFQVAVELAKERRLLIARLGDREVFHQNEWGALLRIFEEATSKRANQKPFSRPPGRWIEVFKPDGSRVFLKPGSTIFNFLEQEYGDKTAFCSDQYINLQRVTINNELIQGDVIRVVLEQSAVNVAAPSGEMSHNLQVKHRIDDISAQARQGIDRLLLEINKYLLPWHIEVREDQLPVLLNQLGANTGDLTIKNVFARLAVDSSWDYEFCELALQYGLNQLVRPENDFSLPYIPWRNVTIAKCCNPVPSDQEIIGTIHRDKNNLLDEEETITLRIHRKGCPLGPINPANEVRLRWITPERSPIGLIINVFMKDDRGSFGRLLNLLYNSTSLTLYSAAADGIHFKPEAWVSIQATGPSEYAYLQAETLLKHHYGIDKVHVARMNKSDVYTLLNAKTQPPHPTITEALMESDTPVLGLSVGRQHELEQLLSMVNSDLRHFAIIEGFYRVGKTWLLKCLQEKLANTRSIPIYVNCEKIERKTGSSLGDIAYDIHFRAKLSLGHYPELWRERGIVHGNHSKNLSDLDGWIRRINSFRFKPVILLDEFSFLTGWYNENYLTDPQLIYLLKFIESNANCKFVVVLQSAALENMTESKSEKFNSYFKGWQDLFIKIDPFSDTEASDLLQKPMHSQYDFSLKALERISELSGNIAFVTALLGNMLWEHARDNELKTIEVDTVDVIAAKINIKEEWRHYLQRLIKPLDNSTLETLKQLARQTTSDRWLDESLFVDMDRNIADNFRDLVYRLSKIGIVEHNVKEGQHYWRVRGLLLSTYLASI